MKPFIKLFHLSIFICINLSSYQFAYHWHFNLPITYQSTLENLYLLAKIINYLLGHKLTSQQNIYLLNKIITYLPMSQIPKDKYNYGPKSFGLQTRTSFVDEGDKTLPGPGTHENVRFNQTNPPQWVVGNDTQRNTFLQKHHFEYPPPNIYNPKFQKTRTNFPNYSIPVATQQYKQKHIDQNNSLLYKPNYKIDKFAYPQFTMGYFEEQDYRTCTPSPNQYHRQTQKQFFNRTQHSFSVSQRPNPYGQNAKFPGSTAYKYESYRPPVYEYTIGKSERPQNLVGPDAPGTFYQISGNMSKTGKGKTLAPQYPSSETKKQDFPSPDKYTPLYLKSKKNIITTYGNRAPLQNVAVVKYPSPQKYSTQSDFYKRKSYSFTKQFRDKSCIIDTPGPGTHQIDAMLATTSGVMGKKLKDEMKFITPGADQYVPRQEFIRQSSPRVINFYSNRVDFSKSLTGRKVGPGSYQIQKQTRAELGKISKSVKFAKESNRNPGPGSYYIPSSIGKLPKYYTGAKKLTKDGYSTFTMQMWQKQKRQQQRVQELETKQKQEQALQQNMQKSQVN